MTDGLTESGRRPGRHSSRLMTRRVFLGSSAFAMTAGVALGANGFIEPFRIQRTRVRVSIRDLPPEFAGYRIGQMSDLHLPWRMTSNFIQRAHRALLAMKPDVVVLTGDLVDEKGEAEARDFAGIFDNCSAPDGVLAVLGNHDHWFGADAVREELKANTPVRLIDHTHVMLERGNAKLAIGGVGDLWTDIVDLRATFGSLSPDIPRVLLSHNPDVAESSAKDGVRVDLQLSGHTHGGEVSFPFFGSPTIPSRYGNKYGRGLVQGPAWPVYVNRGLCSPRFIRFGCRPEVTCLELVAA